MWVFPKIRVPRVPPNIHFKRVFHYKPSILGYPYFRKHPCEIDSTWKIIPAFCLFFFLQLGWYNLWGTMDVQCHIYQLGCFCFRCVGNELTSAQPVAKEPSKSPSPAFSEIAGEGLRISIKVGSYNRCKWSCEAPINGLMNEQLG